MKGRKALLYQYRKENKAMKTYTINVYPCDLDAMGECPKKCYDCKNCVPYPIEYEEDEEED